MKTYLIIALVVIASVAAAWVGWRHFGRPQPKTAVIRNVVLISIDTCRADRLSCYGYARPSTPHIDALAAEGVLFANALTPVPATTPAHSSMLTGSYPPTHGVRMNNGERLPDSNVTLAETLKKAGYRTGAFVGGFPVDARFGLNQGFDTYDGQYTRQRFPDLPADERTAEEVSRPAMAWLDKNADKPFFLFLHYYDAHLPYAPPPPYASTFADDPYAGEIAYVDHWIGQVIDRLRAIGAYEDTLVIVTADHGESLNEHNETSHGYFMYQSTMHVPLVIRLPHARKGLKEEGNVSLVDIVPTVLDLAGLEPPSQVQGISLRGPLEGGALPDRTHPIYGESLWPATFDCGALHGIVEGPWKYIRSPRQELYDLSQDLTEKNNLVDKEPKVAQRLRERLERALREGGPLRRQTRRPSRGSKASGTWPAGRRPPVRPSTPNARTPRTSS
ncbi:MAG: sulfatase [Planctomycetota bacterium]|nr:sulfatase [Planctomycetota bacterium]